MVEQSTHPARETLAAFGLGKLQPTEAMTVETHIADCEECCETLHGLGNDTFADLIRQSDAVPVDSFDNDGTIGLHESGTETVSDLPFELTKHDRYRVLELLGKGGMGNVYKAEHTLMNREVALKVINPELVQNAQAVERFHREVQSAAQLSHPNIVTAYDAEQAGDMHFLVMEYMPGDNLADVVKRDGPLDISLASDYIRQAALGLQHAHEKGMVHRDVKPHNLMVTLDGQLKILDFGLATLTADAIADGETNATSLSVVGNGRSTTLTSAGAMMGTPDFISPEQAKDARTADIRSDLYSLGCTYYYLLAGKPPFAKGSALERVKAHSETEPEPIEDVRLDIPVELAVIVRRLMAKEPDGRFQTPADVSNALEAFVSADQRAPAASAQEQEPTRTLTSRDSWWPPTTIQLLLGTLLVVAGVILAASMATENKRPSIEVLHSGWEVVSPDQTKICAFENGKTFIKDRSSNRILLEITDEFKSSPNNVVWSHDSKQIAAEYIEDDHNHQIRIASAEDGKVTTIHRSRERLLVEDWAPNGKAILCLSRKQDRTFTLVMLSVPKGAPRNLVSFGWENAGHARFSPDGKYIAFNKQDASGLSRIYIIDVAGTDLRPLTQSGEAEEHPIWVQDEESTFVVYTVGSQLRTLKWDNGRAIGDPQFVRSDWRDYSKRASLPGELMFHKTTQLTHIYEVGVSGQELSTPSRITKKNLSRSPAWSPDGNRMAYLGPGLKILSRDSGSIQSLQNPLHYSQYVFWSPDSDTLAIGPGIGNDPMGVSTISLRTGKLQHRPLIRFSKDWVNGEGGYPKGFTADGRKFVMYGFKAEDGTYKENVAYDLESGEEEQITFEGCNERVRHFDISPDQKRIAYVTCKKDDTGWKLVIADTDFQNRITIAENDAKSEWSQTFSYPRWSPDGTMLSFFELRPKDGAPKKKDKILRLSSADGKWQSTVDIGNLKHWFRSDSAPVWSPNSSKLTLTLTEGPYIETSVLRNFLPTTVNAN